MAIPGKHGKMLILAFADSKAAESGGVAEADDSFEALINPENYTLSYKLKFSPGGQGQGTSGKQLKYEYSEPTDLTFEFLFDNTGIIDGEPRDSIADDLLRFRKVVIDYQGDSHEPRHFKLVWGENSIFKGRVTAVDINYKLFKSDGTPIRATARVTFKSSIEEEKRAAKENKQSPDLTQARRIKRGDTLPQLCYLIYGDPSYYLQVAARNGLTDFRSLKPGSILTFPPLAKTSTTVMTASASDG
ncbi:CIS tube protein [Paraburkholderia sp. RL17-337-BIB-A]|uniref:CIS tube protein n=1 Tax=Paraburkholderia sp. RL17-337-BIB-A TaxID=3031636 RepID=UPI0038B902B8